jgi:murein DD-endopeptidase MepM/ murein hydrolase activator NlpD
MPHRSTAGLRPRDRRTSRLKPLGFIHLDRRTVALTAAALVSLTTFVYTLPASGAEIDDSSTRTASQVLVNDALSTTMVDRDGFTVSAAIQWPVPASSPISSGFGYRVPPCGSCSSDHQGVDFTPGAGYPVQAIAEGVVREIGNPSGELGVFAIIDHVIDGELVSSVYGHMKLGSLTVKVGDHVSTGEQLGLVGSTGQSTGAHLHFGILDNGTDAIDPLAWLRKHAL